ncbi:class I SAM-dependent methyltransferase [Stakelama tenebrarum]|uniref:Class I SAM-dependent methyltransferase n=1 Tax=Stakelama tenebrarum TaxID=2711215 RepID=A0A6G6Y899_9SPHN|nr:class I SAM-dependent methyltransferase [Sphingosinithalassobacter tenebrarum]QIG81164.1 class I SAM-dependent methyltransferase [Sphingosinithalassobacter tenebrarum]
MTALYDTIGVNYVQLRRPDPRIAAAIHRALGDARSVLNVGAGTGSYEPADRRVTAVEPSTEMIARRAADAAPAIQGVAEALPFPDDSFDASMAVLTLHHWTDKAAGLREMRRVTRGPVVLVTFDPAQRPWLTDYLPQLAALDEAQMPTMADYADWLGDVTVSPLEVPHDCSDGFLYAYWRRPAAYLDPRIRSGISSFWALDDLQVGLDRLRDDLNSGEWPRRHAALLAREAYDAGYRLIVAR